MDTKDFVTLYELREELEKNDLLSLMLPMSAKNLDDLFEHAKVIAAQAANEHTQVSLPVCSLEADRK